MKNASPKRAVDQLVVRFGPHALVAITVVFNLVSLRAERLFSAAANDGPQHLAMIEWAQQRIEAGHLPFDGWYHILGFGSPHFHHYQSFPHIVGGALGTLFGAENVYAWSLYLLLAVWPVCVYMSGRLFGADRWTSAAAGVVALLVASHPSDHIGFEFGAYTRGGYGVWAQLFGMWLIPLALALTWRAMNGRGSVVWAAIAMALLMASHFLTGYLAVVIIGVWVLVDVKDLWPRIRRTATVAVTTLLVGAWAIAPPVLDAKWASRQEWLLNTFYTDSYGLKVVVGRLLGGDLFDAGRVPIITILVGIGIAVCIARWQDRRARALLLLFGTSLALYSGRSVVGFVLDRLPIGEDILLHRYLMGVHLGGIFLAGVGGVWLVGRAAKEVRELIPPPPTGRRARERALTLWRPSSAEVTAGVAIFALVFLIPAVRERHGFNRAAAAAIGQQRLTDASDGRDLRQLISIARSRKDGRVYAGVSAGDGELYKVGGAPVYKILATEMADGVGYIERTLSLPQNVERLFSTENKAHYELFNARYVLSDLPLLRVPAKRVATRGRHTLWRVETSGYIDVVDTSGSVTAGRDDLGRSMQSFLATDAPLRRVYPTVAFDGRPAARPTLTGERPKKAPGRVLDQSARPEDGVFRAEVDVRRRSVVLLKSSFDPRWRVTVDGERVEPQMLAPAFVGVPVDAGRHTVSFVYEPLSWYGPLFGLAALTLLGLAVMPRLWARRTARTPSQTP